MRQSFWMVAALLTACGPEAMTGWKSQFRFQLQHFLHEQ